MEKIDTSSAAIGTGGSSITAAASDGNAITADFDTFIRLLTTELRNQDPLNPLQSTDFVAQLASFSSVEQQIKTNALLEAGLSGLTGSPDIAAAATLIGKDVGFPGPIDYDGSGVAVDAFVDPVTNATSAQMVVTDDFGQVISTRSVEPAATNVSWDGRRMDGTVAPAGRYSIAINYSNGSNAIGTAQVSTNGTVAGVEMGRDGVNLISRDGREVLMENVSRISEIM